MEQEQNFVVYTERQGFGAESFQPRELFPRFDSIRGDMERWQYLRDEILKLARAEGLYLTDVLNQRQDITDAAGDVLFNCITLSSSEEHAQQALHNPLPPELIARCIRVKSIGDRTVRWCQDIVPGAPIGRGRTSGSPHRRAEAQIVDTQKKDVMLTPQEAWLCLKEGGKFVVRAKRKDHQQRVWHFEEVRPESNIKPEEPAQKTRKSFGEANRG